MISTTVLNDIGMYYEVHDVIMQKSTCKNIASVNSINGGRITDYVTCANGYLCDKGTSSSIPSFVIVSPI